MATREWLRFFQDAGIPPGPALGYAVAFVDNRIHKDMLLELTRELMKELGITVVGDVIAILRHARLVHSQELCRAASQELQPEPPRERPPSSGSPRIPRDPPRSAAAGRMIRKSLSRDPPPGPPRAPPGICVTVANGAAAGGSSSSSPPAVAGKRRRVTAEQEGQFRISLPEGIPARSRKILQLQEPRGPGRTSVFERLGAEAKAEGKPSGVFSRLGADPDPAEPPEEPPEEPPLPYVGVLKRQCRECGSGAAPEPGGAPLAQDGAVSSSGLPEFRGGSAETPPRPRPRSVFRRLGRKQP